MGLRTEWVVGNLQEKLNGIEAESMILMNDARPKLKAVEADEMMNYLQEKLKQLLLMLENFGLFVAGWFDEVFPPETRKERLRHWIRVGAPYVVAGLVLLVLFCCFGRCILNCTCCCLEAVKMMASCCCRCIRNCACCCLKAVKMMSSSCGRSIRFCCSPAVKMMKAPGTGGKFIIPRNVFEANPQGYFCSLRAGEVKF